MSEQRSKVTWASGLAILGMFSGCADEQEHRTLEPEALRGAELAFPSEEPEPNEGWFFVAKDVEEIPYQFRGEYAVHQGDIILGHVDDLSPAQLGEEGLPSAAVKPDSLWASGIVPFELAGVSDSTRDAFMAAVAHWHEHTALRFVPRDGHADYVRVIEGDGCYSYVGRIGGPQDLSLGPRCDTLGVAAHEIGHAIGLWHEQSRSDRDSNVVVHWENIEPDYEFAFYTYDEGGWSGEDVGDYDLDSLMHYGSYYFSIDYGNKPTITRLDGSEIVPNRTRLGAGDIAGAKRLYGGGVDLGGCNIALKPGETLYHGESVTSCDKRFVLIMQNDGNLVLYQHGVGALWHTVTHGTDATRAVMQGDGNLVVYNDAGYPHWHSHTWGHPGSFLALQDDGNLVVYNPGVQPLWASNTCCR